MGEESLDDLRGLGLGMDKSFMLMQRKEPEGRMEVVPGSTRLCVGEQSSHSSTR